MPRDNEKYLYLTIGVLRGSETHQALLKDAEEHNTRQLPTLAGIRLSEFYKLMNKGLITAATTSSPKSLDIASDVDELNEAWPE